jgi:hypothetical protein
MPCRRILAWAAQSMRPSTRGRLPQVPPAARPSAGHTHEGSFFPFPAGPFLGRPGLLPEVPATPLQGLVARLTAASPAVPPPGNRLLSGHPSDPRSHSRFGSDCYREDVEKRAQGRLCFPTGSGGPPEAAIGWPPTRCPPNRITETAVEASHGHGCSLQVRSGQTEPDALDILRTIAA